MYGYRSFNRGVVSALVLAALVSIAVLLSAGSSRAAGEVKIEWLTWSFFRITTPGGKVILTNPWYTNPDSSISLDDIPEADIILVPTGHPDEVGNAREIAAKTGATIVASHELINLVWKDKGAGFRDPVTFDGITIQTKYFNQAQRKQLMASPYAPSPRCTATGIPAVRPWGFSSLWRTVSRSITAAVPISPWT